MTHQADIREIEAMKANCAGPKSCIRTHRKDHSQQPTSTQGLSKILNSVKTLITFLECFVVKGYKNINNAALAYYIKYESCWSVAHITNGYVIV